MLKGKESPEEALKRELIEELNLRVEIEKIIEVENHKSMNHITIVFSCKPLSEKIVVDNEEIKEAEYFNVESLPEKILSIHRPFVTSYLNYKTDK